ncbi:hypothetical protein QBC39DRAFT_346016 [Podospora conica]|nr:hypothetical protein QBC39DRAFT_346016 [Schizothecium conicum]
MGRARLPSVYAKIQLGLRALALGAALATLAAALYVTSVGFGHGSGVALAIVAAVLALALDTWELVALSDATGRRKRLPAVYLAISDLLVALVCFVWRHLTEYTAHLHVPGCNMNAPIKDCVSHYELLMSANWRTSLTWKLSLGLGFMHGIFLLMAIFDRFWRRKVAVKESEDSVEETKGAVKETA